MALDGKIGSFNVTLGAAGNVFSVTNVGFLPKVIFFWHGGRQVLTDGLSQQNVYKGWGYTAKVGSGTFNYSVSERSGDAVGSSSEDRRLSDNSCVSLMANANVASGRLAVQTLDADGFTMAVEFAFGVDLCVSYLALGGSTLTDVAVGSFESPAATGSQSMTGLSFSPDFVFIMGAAIATATNTPENTLCIGMATGPANQWTFAMAADDNVGTTLTRRYGITSEVLALVSQSLGTTTYRAAFTQFTSSGFDLDWLETNIAGLDFRYLALNFGGHVKVGSFLTRTDTGSFGTGSLGFQPRAALFVSHCAPEAFAPDMAAVHDQWSMGGATEHQQMAQATRNEDAQGTSDTVCALQNNAVYLNLADASYLGQMARDGWAHDAVNAYMTDPDPAPALVGYAVFGEASSPGRRFFLSGA